MKYFIGIVAAGVVAAGTALAAGGPLRVLNFQADNGYQHQSKAAALALVERLGEKNGWVVVTTKDSASLTGLELGSFDAVVFNNNCGNKGPVMKPAEQRALRNYIQHGGGFVGVHCAGALWKEGGAFQAWYEGLIGTRLIDHPKVQQARLVVEDRSHPATRHLPEEWRVVDEFHRFGSNPRADVNVLISVDENSYQGEQKMGGDHPFVWCHEYDGGRSFFTSLGHTREIYRNPRFEKLIEGAVLWAGGGSAAGAEASPNGAHVPVRDGLFLDLDANAGVELEEGNRVKAWRNQVRGNAAEVFVKRDAGRKQAGSGRPTLKKHVAEIGGNHTLVFEEQELVNMDEDAFDHLVTGSGYTWFSVMSVDRQHVGKKDVNSFFGNLRNGPPYDGFWGNLMDDNRVWMGTRNGIQPEEKPKRQPLWDAKLNPCVASGDPLEVNRYYLVMGRMGAGKEVVDLELFINSATPVDRKPVPVNPQANPSKMAVGQERDATTHPGKESFHGEIARLLIYDRALDDAEMAAMVRHLSAAYQIRSSE
ncbi:MAG: ThuA domain-containing protein [Verrucomicrobiota bacterium JB025]|nr:ThuA domain-containing protein [Verrucomicrobiota bacterium JB025]